MSEFLLPQCAVATQDFTWVSMTRVRFHRWLTPVLFGVLAMMVYGTLSVTQMDQLASPSWDLGIFSEAVKAYAHGQAPIATIKGDSFNLLGDHFHPILALLAPLWVLWPSPMTLLWAQAALFGISVIPLTRLAMDCLGELLGAVSGLVYAFSFGLQSAQASQFHEVAFAVPLLAFALTSMLRGKLRAACLWAGLLVFCKEDLGLTVAVFGAIIALRYPRGFRPGLALTAWGLAWFVVTTRLIIPSINTGGAYPYASNLGSLAGAFGPAVKWGTVAMLVLAAGVWGLRSPLILLMVPTLAWRFMGTSDTYWGWQWHYSAVLMPIAFAALIDGVRRDRTWVKRGAVVISVCATAMLGSSMPLATLAQSKTWVASPRLSAAQAAMAAVPAGATVGTDTTLLAQLVPGHDVQMVQDNNARVPRCVVEDQWAFSWGSNGGPTDAAAWADTHFKLAPGSYTVVFEGDWFTTACLDVPNKPQE